MAGAGDAAARAPDPEHDGPAPGGAPGPGSPAWLDAQGPRLQRWLQAPGQADADDLAALRHAFTALTPAQATPARVETLLCLLRLHYLRTEASVALEMAEHAVVLAQACAGAAPSPLLRQALSYRGVIQMDTGRFIEALSSQSEALSVAMAMDAAGDEASVWCNLGLLLCSLSQFEQAIACFTRALERSPPQQHWSIVTAPALGILASCALHLNDVGRGLAAARRAIALYAQPAGPTEALARAVSESLCARLLLSIGEVPAAAPHVQQALHWARVHPSARMAALAALTEGLCQVHAGQAERGLDNVRYALGLARRHLPSDVHDCLEAAIAAYRHAGQPDVALVYLHELQALHRNTRAARAMAQHEAHLARLESGTGAVCGDLHQAITLRHDALRRELGDREQLRRRMQLLEEQAVAAELHDDTTGRHCYRVGRLASLLGREIGLEDDVCFLIDLAARLHDIGKLAVPDAILLKPGRLSDDERLIVQAHTTAGAEMLAGSRVPQMHVAETIARHHHERWDGRGYPDGLSGRGIPIAARVTALADVFDALTHSRPYKAAWSVDDALAEIGRLRGTHFDPELTDVFLQLVPRLVREVGDLDAFLGAEALHSSFIRARDRVAQALRPPHDNECELRR